MSSKRLPGRCVSVALLVAASTLAAQTKPTVEIGTRAGWSFLSYSDEDEIYSVITLPGASVQGLPTLYVAFFPTEEVVVEPQLGFDRYSDGDDAYSRLRFGVAAKYLFLGASESSPYMFADGAMSRLSHGDDSETEYGFGGGLGYRFVATEHLAVTLEGRYRRWFFDAEDTFVGVFNEFALVVGFGAVVR